MDITNFLNANTLHDSGIESIEIRDNRLVIKIDNLRVGNGLPATPGELVIEECDGISLNYTISNWILNANAVKKDGKVTLVMNLNTGAKLIFNGIRISVNEK